MANSVANAVQPVVSSHWLTVDTTAAQAGYGPARVPGPEQHDVPVVPVPDSPLDPAEPVSVPDSDGYQYDPEGDGPWPYVWDGGLHPQPPVQRQECGVPQGGNESLLPQNSFPGQWNSYQSYAGYDAVSQNVDTAGWKQNVPDGRAASWNTFGQSNPENVPTWYDFGERHVMSHLAVQSVDMSSDVNGPGFYGATNGSLPSWDLMGPQGNTAYETPGPPQTSQPDSSGGLIDMGWA